MKIAVVGLGVVGKSIVEHLILLGHEVFQIDRDTVQTLDEVATVADVVFILTLPIEGVAALIRQAASLMRPGTLLVHGTSIENPKAPNQIDTGYALGKGITICHLHFHFRPGKPLTRTMYGQHMTVAIAGADGEKWASWIDDQFSNCGPITHRLPVGQHDEVTSVSQLLHMIIAFVIGSVWLTTGKKRLQIGLEIGGPPARFLSRMFLRVAQAPGVIESILLNHPLALETIRRMELALDELRSLILRARRREIADRLSLARGLISPPDLPVWDALTSDIIQLEADLRKDHYLISFPAQLNQPGLLERVSRVFTKHQVNVVAFFAFDTDDGGCRFQFGVRGTNDSVNTAVEEITGWLK